MTESSTRALLEIGNLRIGIRVGREDRVLVRDVSLRVRSGESLGIVGESGSGKSLTVRSIMQLLPRRAETGGEISVDGVSMLGLRGSPLREMRRTTLAMIHQDPRSAINPMRTIGDFMTEAVRHLPRDERFALAATALADVGIDDAERRFRQFPHQLSGGLLQRVMIAAVLMPGPRLVLADEPTTALDVTSQSEVMAVLTDLQRERGVGMVYITHDLDLAAAVTDSLAVMYAGSIVESGSTADVYERPLHPYTVALLASRPDPRTVRPLRTIAGRPASAYEVGEGCSFAARCPFAQDRCRETRPLLRPVDGQSVACHRAEELRGHIREELEVAS